MCFRVVVIVSVVGICVIALCVVYIRKRYRPMLTICVLLIFNFKYADDFTLVSRNLTDMSLADEFSTGNVKKWSVQNRLDTRRICC